jgi:hypothetical protein
VAVFAWHISRGEKITVVSPPPERFHPSGPTNYQAMEEPILKDEIGGSALLQIEMVHPTVKGAENFCYQIWPVGETRTWIENLRWSPQGNSVGRRVKIILGNLGIREVTKISPVRGIEDGDVPKPKES